MSVIIGWRDGKMITADASAASPLGGLGPLIPRNRALRIVLRVDERPNFEEVTFRNVVADFPPERPPTRLRHAGTPTYAPYPQARLRPDVTREDLGLGSGDVVAQSGVGMVFSRGRTSPGNEVETLARKRDLIVDRR